MKNMLRLLALAIPALLVGCNKNQYTAYGLAGTTIIEFDTKTPSKVDTTVTLGTISSTVSGDTVATIFFGTDGTLYCTTTSYELCTIDLSSGDVTLVTGSSTSTGSDPITLFSDTAFNADYVTGNLLISDTVTAYDPVNSDIRVFAKDSGTGSSVPNQGKTDNLNFSIDPSSLAADNTAGDDPLVYASGDSNGGKNPILVSIAYSSPVSGATSTTLYGIDSSTGDLVRVGDANATSASTSVHDGQVHTIGTLGVSASNASLAIEAKNGDGFVVVGTTLYSIDLGSGTMSSIGTISDGSSTITSLAFDPSE